MVHRWGRSRVSTPSCLSSSWTSCTYSAPMSKTTLISPHGVETHLKVLWPRHAFKRENKQTTTLEHGCAEFPFYHPDCQSERPEGQMGTVMENMVLFSTTLLQKLYSGTFLGDNENLLNFLADQIGVVRQTHRQTSTCISSGSKINFAVNGRFKILNLRHCL